MMRDEEEEVPFLQDAPPAVPSLPSAQAVRGRLSHRTRRIQRPELL